MRYTYPAVLFQKDGRIRAVFPDLPDCRTESGSWEEAEEAAEDALGTVLRAYEDYERRIPSASLSTIRSVPHGARIAYITVDTRPLRAMSRIDA